MTISKNKLFEKTVLEYKSHYDIMLNKSFKYIINLNLYHISNQLNTITTTINNKIKQYSFINLGIIQNNEFTWLNLDTRDALYDILIDSQFIENGYITLNFLNKFFTNQSFKINKRNKYFIIYLISMITSYNIIKFISDDNNIEYFGMIQLKIKDGFNFNQFMLKLDQIFNMDIEHV
jgi:hypothetical protein